MLKGELLAQAQASSIRKEWLSCAKPCRPGMRVSGAMLSLCASGVALLIVLLNIIHYAALMPTAWNFDDLPIQIVAEDHIRLKTTREFYEFLVSRTQTNYFPSDSGKDVCSKIKP